MRGGQPRPGPRGAQSCCGAAGQETRSGRRGGTRPSAARQAGGWSLAAWGHGALSSAPTEALPRPLPSSSPPMPYPTLCAAADPCAPGCSSAPSRRKSPEQLPAARRQQGRVRSGRPWSRTASLETPKDRASSTRHPAPCPLEAPPHLPATLLAPQIPGSRVATGSSLMRSPRWKLRRLWSSVM